MALYPPKLNWLQKYRLFFLRFVFQIAWKWPFVKASCAKRLCRPPVVLLLHPYLLICPASGSASLAKHFLHLSRAGIRLHIYNIASSLEYNGAIYKTWKPTLHILKWFCTESLFTLSCAGKEVHSSCLSIKENLLFRMAIYYYAPLSVPNFQRSRLAFFIDSLWRFLAR